MSGTLALASAIAEMERPVLRALVRARRPQATVSILDPIGLASDLLRPESVHRAVSGLSAEELALLLALAQGDDVTDAGSSGAGRGEDADPDPDPLAPLAALGLVGLDAGARVALPEVGAAIEAGLASSGRRLAPPVADAEQAPNDAERTAAPEPAPPVASVWVDTALSAVGRCAECLRQLVARPVRLNRTGAVSYAGAKAIAERTGIDVAAVQSAFEVLGLAGLTARVPGEQLLVAGAGAQAWLDAGMADRWLALAGGALTTLSAPLRAVLAASEGDLRGSAERIADRFPLLPEDDREAAARAAALAESVGLSVDGRLTEPAELLLANRAEAARERVESGMPALAAGVYLQPDLSVIVPGPLAPSAEAALAELTVPEHIGIASTRRITESAVAEALERGLTADEARASLAALSLTGVPQPLEYLITSLAERVGSIVVTDHDGDDGRSRIAVSRPALADTLLVDRALQHLQLRRSAAEPDVLLSRLRSEHVVAALADARYHATVPGARGPRAGLDPDPSLRGADRGAGATAAGSGSGSAAGSPAGATAGAPAGSDDRAEALEALVDRVFESARTEPGTGDFMRRIELAIRERRAVLVTAEAAGQTRSFTLLPVSVSGGRLRASDQAAGVERTLPVNLITSVEAV